MLGQALERRYRGHLTIGPALKDGGFYYDMALPLNEDGSPRHDNDSFIVWYSACAFLNPF